MTTRLRDYETRHMARPFLNPLSFKIWAAATVMGIVTLAVAGPLYGTIAMAATLTGFDLYFRLSVFSETKQLAAFYVPSQGGYIRLIGPVPFAAGIAYIVAGAVILTALGLRDRWLLLAWCATAPVLFAIIERKAGG